MSSAIMPPLHAAAAVTEPSLRGPCSAASGFRAGPAAAPSNVRSCHCHNVKAHCGGAPQRLRALRRDEVGQGVHIRQPAGAAGLERLCMASPQQANCQVHSGRLGRLTLLPGPRTTCVVVKLAARQR